MEQHIQPLITDYVLDLLPESERRRLESHLSQCAGCREAVAREEGLEMLVRQTVQLATQPLPARLQALRPAVIPRRPSRSTRLARQLAPAMLFLILIAGLALQVTQFRNDLGLRAPVFYRAATPTATSTSTPTATIAAIINIPLTAPPAEATSVMTAGPIGPVPAVQPTQPPIEATPAALAAPTTN